MESEAVKFLKIKTRSCENIMKELVYYKKEAEAQEEKIDTLSKEGVDKYVVRKQREVLEESLMMIVDSVKRLRDSSEDLSNYLGTSSDKLDKLSDEYARAENAVRESLMAVELEK